MRVTSAGKRRHQVYLYRPGTSVPDGDGGFTEVWEDMSPPTTLAAIESATARNMERLFANTVIASATHLVTFPYRGDVRITTRLVFGTRVFSVVGLQNPEERNIELVLACVEMFDATPVVPQVPWVQTGWMQEELV